MDLRINIVYKRSKQDNMGQWEKDIWYRGNWNYLNGGYETGSLMIDIGNT